MCTGIHLVKPKGLPSTGDASSAADQVKDSEDEAYAEGADSVK